MRVMVVGTREGRRARNGRRRRGALELGGAPAAAERRRRGALRVRRRARHRRARHARAPRHRPLACRRALAGCVAALAGCQLAHRVVAAGRRCHAALRRRAMAQDRPPTETRAPGEDAEVLAVEVEAGRHRIRRLPGRPRPSSPQVFSALHASSASRGVGGRLGNMPPPGLKNTPAPPRTTDFAPANRPGGHQRLELLLQRQYCCPRKQKPRWPLAFISNRLCF